MLNTHLNMYHTIIILIRKHIFLNSIILISMHKHNLFLGYAKWFNWTDFETVHPKMLNMNPKRGNYFIIFDRKEEGNFWVKGVPPIFTVYL